ncbi:MAG TPA: hypothetical protein DCE41_05550 [Cytophagales bacterium]|nr:hypothetical protein [Cytophagales bacterium]HAA18660.1 hypothetical protein [Cytophagales bacterium]HAP62261.1 hypothetical protein [Cytophagales bacterium]
MIHKDPKEMVEHYLSSYNALSVDGMIQHLHPEVVFENYAHEELTLKLEGKQAFTDQAEEAVSLFEKRHIHPTQWHVEQNRIKIMLQYEAICAKDFMGLKKGERIALSGSSVFYFEQNQIIKIVDASGPS